MHAENVHLDPNEVEPLLRYILLELYKRFPDGSTLSFSEKYRVLKVMKTVMFAIERAAASGSGVNFRRRRFPYMYSGLNFEKTPGVTSDNATAVRGKFKSPAGGGTSPAKFGGFPPILLNFRLTTRISSERAEKTLRELQRRRK